jgi:hypothetical protein
MEEGKHNREYEGERCRFFLVCDLLVVVALRLLSLLLMNSAMLVTWLSSYEDQCKNRYEGLMPRNDEELKGSSYRTKGHIENKEHLGMGSLCCNNLDLCCGS